MKSTSCRAEIAHNQSTHHREAVPAFAGTGSAAAAIQPRPHPNPQPRRPTPKPQNSVMPAKAGIQNFARATENIVESKT
jgi:hypothetical protein